MTHITCRLTAKKRDQLRNPTLGTRVWGYLYLFYLSDVATLPWEIQKLIFQHYYLYTSHYLP